MINSEALRVIEILLRLLLFLGSAIGADVSGFIIINKIRHDK